LVPNSTANRITVSKSTPGKMTAVATAAAPVLTPIARETGPGPTPAPAIAPVLPPRPRAAPALPLRKQAAPAAVAATSSTSKADTDALENVIELIRRHKPDDATQVQATIADPVANKLAEWIILRSDNNNASVERYRAFISANPSWPSQAFLRRRLEAALWDDHREDAVVWSWFEGESPSSAKGRFALARAMLARGDPAYIFSKIQLLRREEKFAEAAALMLSAPRDPARLYNLDEWWIERRLLARKMIDSGEHRTAYLIARDAALPTRDIYKTEQEFTAGWIALRFLTDPALASQHFARVGVGSVNPTTLARAGYWQGRAAEAAGRSQEARTAYAAAAEQSTSYYGQLARAKLGMPQLELNDAPTARVRGVERLEIVRAVQLLFDLDERDIAIPIFADMGENGDPD